MTAAPFDNRDVSLKVGRIIVHAGSPIDARRLADALPAALERALRGAPAPTRRPSHADRAAGQIVAAIRAAQGAGQ